MKLTLDEEIRFPARLRERAGREEPDTSRVTGHGDGLAHKVDAVCDAGW